MSYSSALSPIINSYQALLRPIPAFAWLGFPLTTLDLGATVRLCLVMRQIREANLVAHVKKRQVTSGSSNAKDNGVEERSIVRDLTATLIVVYGGEAITAPLLNQTPSFMISGTVPLLYTLTQAVVEYLPNSLLPVFNFQSELPLAAFDALTRAFLLCNLIPPMVVASASSAVSTSPWTLLITSLITANTGFFVLNSLSFLQPGPLSLTTPAELLPYGWSTTDLWCAPLITGLYALLTHAQPFWAEAHAILAGLLGSIPEDPTTTEKSPGVQPLDAETARAVCAAVLGVMFVARAVKNYGGGYRRSWQSKRNVKVISRHGKSRSVNSVGKIKVQ